MRLLNRAIFIPAATIISLTILFSDPVISLADTAGMANTAGIEASVGDSAAADAEGASGVGSTAGTTGTTGTSINVSGAAITSGSGITTDPTITTGTAITSGSAIETGGDTDSTTKAAVSTTDAAVKADDESKWYNPKIPMKKDYQKLLWENCQEKKLDYIDMLALISIESDFDEKCVTGKCKGLFQISSVHFAELSKLLKTPNKPLDGAVNIKWGTTMYSWALHDKRTKGLTGKKLRDVALSIYQRGPGGYDRYGISSKYLSAYYKRRDMVLSWFKK